MSKVLELFGTSTSTQQTIDWQKIVSKQICIFSGKGCFKVRKSQPNIAIGTCSVAYGKDDGMIIICPNRLLEANQVFLDAMHLLTNHEPGNQIHVVPEISIPGGSVDYFLVSVKNKKVMDFVGVEFQTLDTTGTVWPERQRFLKEKGFRVAEKDVASEKTFGMNWKMTAKTILIQLHHKVQTFEEINKHFLLVIQDSFFAYMKKEFCFDHLNSARLGDPMHIHTYRSTQTKSGKYALGLTERHSTDTAGIATCLGLQADAKVALEEIVKQIESKISPKTRISISVS
jgi:Restriction endonuclease NotI